MWDSNPPRHQLASYVCDVVLGELHGAGDVPALTRGHAVGSSRHIVQSALELRLVPHWTLDVGESALNDGFRLPKPTSGDLSHSLDGRDLASRAHIAPHGVRAELESVEVGHVVHIARHRTLRCERDGLAADRERETAIEPVENQRRTLELDSRCFIHPFDVLTLARVVLVLKLLEKTVTVVTAR